MPLRLAWASDAGLVRDENEDSVAVAADIHGLDALLVLADGMGGHAAGQVASRMAVEEVLAEINEHPALDGEHLREALSRANSAVYTASREESEHAGMGSTLVIVAIEGDRLGLLNVGDSPAYLFRSGAMTEIYQNHNWPSEQLRAGIITEDELVNHPLKHRLARAVGVWDHVKAYTAEHKLEQGDLVVICSDGVEEAGVTPEEIRATLEDDDLQSACDSLIRLCRERGAPDNVTVAAARVE